MNRVKFIREVLHQVNSMVQQNFTNRQKITILITFFYDQLFQVTSGEVTITRSHSVFTVRNTKAIIQKFKNLLPPDNYTLISFDVTLFFTNIPLDYTVSII